MKVLVPVDVESKHEIEIARRLIEGNAWPENAQFYLLNVIEKPYPGEPCTNDECIPRCQCVETRTARLRELLMQLSRERPDLCVFIEVTSGDLGRVIANRLDNDPALELLLSRPINLKRSVGKAGAR